MGGEGMHPSTFTYRMGMILHTHAPPPHRVGGRLTKRARGMGVEQCLAESTPSVRVSCRYYYDYYHYLCTPVSLP